MTRHGAATIHLGLSILIIGAALIGTLLLWYPGPWFRSMGGGHLILILAGVDISIGPLLTWIVFRPEKKELKFDLAVIASLQLAALIYGAHILYTARPVYMIFVSDQFRVLTAAELDPILLRTVRYPEFKEIPTSGPRIASTATPTDPKERQDLIFFSLEKGVDLHQMPRYWVPYSGQSVLPLSQTLASLRAIDPANAKMIDGFLSSNGRNESSLRFIPLRTRHKEMAVLIDAGSGDVVDIIDAKPWQ